MIETSTPSTDLKAQQTIYQIKLHESPEENIEEDTILGIESFFFPSSFPRPKEAFGFYCLEKYS